METTVETVNEPNTEKENYQEVLKQLQEANKKIDKLETSIQKAKAIAEPRTTITTKEEQPAKDIDVYKEVSNVMTAQRNEFRDSLLFNEAESAYEYKNFDGDETNAAYWEEIAVLNCYNAMPEDFKEKYGAKYKALEECRYHDILADHVNRLQKFKTHYKIITGQTLDENQQQNDYYPKLKALYTRIFRKR